MSVIQNSNIKHSSKITYALERYIYQLSRIVVKNIQVRFTYHLEIYISALQNRSRTLRQDYLQAGDIPISCLEQQQRIFRYDLLTAQRYKHISSLEQQYRNTQVRLLTFQRYIYISCLEQEYITPRQDYLQSRDINISVFQNSSIEHLGKITYRLEI